MDHLNMVAVMDVYCKEKNNAYSPKVAASRSQKGRPTPG